MHVGMRAHTHHHMFSQVNQINQPFWGQTGYQSYLGSQVNQINQPFWGQTGYQSYLGWQDPWPQHYSKLITKDTY